MPRRPRPGVPLPSSEDARLRMEATPQRDTGPELALRRAAHALGLRYLVDTRPMDGLRRRADLVFPRARVAVFLDGCFWHGCPEHVTWPRANADFWREKIEANRRRDRDTDQRLREAGWIVLRVWEHEEPGVAAAAIAAVVRARRGPA